MLPYLARLCNKGTLLNNTLSLDSYCFILIMNHILLKAIKAASDTESDVPHLSGMSVITLEGT